MLFQNVLLLFIAFAIDDTGSESADDGKEVQDFSVVSNAALRKEAAAKSDGR